MEGTWKKRACRRRGTVTALTYREWRKTRRIAGVAVEAVIENIPNTFPENRRHILRGLIVLTQTIHPQNLNVAEVASSEEVLTKRSISATRRLSPRLLFIVSCSRSVPSYSLCQQATSRSPPPIVRHAVVTWKPKVRHLRLLTSPCGVILSKALERLKSEWASSWTWKWSCVSVVGTGYTSESYVL